MTGLTTLTVDDLRRIVVAFGSGLLSHKEALNRLNVYPVPDGDTGTNMALTVESVIAEMDQADPDMAATCAAIAHGSLMGARGNSGVILSQILRGVATTLSDHEQIDAIIFTDALEVAADAAYEAVMKPVEGTILTVMRACAVGARSALDAGETSLVSVVGASLEAGEIALARTPELLPVLAEAGVVDAGGAGLLLLFSGVLHVLDGREMPDPPPDEVTAATPGLAGFERPDTHSGDVSDLRYEVMYFLEAPEESIDLFKNAWASIGDSIVVVGGEGLWNCHVHTNDIGAAIEAGIVAGRPKQIRVSDLSEEVEEQRWVREASGAASMLPPREVDRVRCAVVAVSPAVGISRIFESLGVQELVSGGQTMNPSTADLIAAVERAPSLSVVILPNNKNIIAVANQVAHHTEKTVAVLPTTSVPEGFACLLGYDPQISADGNVEAMAEIASDVVVGEVTKAVRDSSSEAGPIATGDWLGLDSSGIRVVRPSLAGVAVDLLDLLIGDEHEIVTIIEGADADVSVSSQIVDWVRQHRPQAETEVHSGGQPHYPYFFGVE